jgi:hypothetical protein
MLNTATLRERRIAKMHRLKHQQQAPENVLRALAALSDNEWLIWERHENEHVRAFLSNHRLQS